MKQQGSMREKALWKNRRERKRTGERWYWDRSEARPGKGRHREEEKEELYESNESDCEQDYTENDKKIAEYEIEFEYE